MKCYHTTNFLVWSTMKWKFGIGKVLCGLVALSTFNQPPPPFRLLSASTLFILAVVVVIVSSLAPFCR